MKVCLTNTCSSVSYFLAFPNKCCPDMCKQNNCVHFLEGGLP